MRASTSAAKLCAVVLAAVLVVAADAQQKSWLEKFLFDDDVGALLSHLDNNETLLADDDRALLRAVANGNVEVRDAPSAGGRHRAGPAPLPSSARAVERRLLPLRTLLSTAGRHRAARPRRPRERDHDGRARRRHQRYQHRSSPRRCRRCTTAPRARRRSEQQEF